MNEDDKYYVLSWRVKKDYKHKVDELARTAGLNTSAYLREVMKEKIDQAENTDVLQAIENYKKEMNEKIDNLEMKLDIITKLLLKN